MSDKEQYIKIEPPFSVNKYLDNTSTEKPSGNFNALKNYIPEHDILRTREGITLFTYTADVSIPTTYDPTTDPGCIIWMRFEDDPGVGTYQGSPSGTLDDEIQGAAWWYVTANTTPILGYYSASLSRIEGSASLYSDFYAFDGAGLGQGIKQQYTSLETINCPGYVDGKHTYIMTIWIRPTYLDSAVKSLYLGRTDYTQAGGWFISIQTGSGSNHIVATIADSNAVTRTISAETNIVVGNWYHIALWSSENVGNSGLVVYDNTNDTETAATASPAIVNAGQYSSMSTLDKAIRLTPTNGSGRGHIDDFIVTLNVPNSEADILTKIRSMRAEARLASANDFSGDSDVVALYRFENNFNDSIGGNSVSAVGNAPDFDYKAAEGLYSVSFSAANSEYLQCTDGNLDADFPGKTGVGGSFTVCFWVKYKTLALRQGLICKYNGGAGQRTLILALESNNQIRFIVGHGATFTDLYNGTAMTDNTWYHVAAAYTTGTKAMKLRIRSEDGTLVGGANATNTATDEFTGTGAAFEIGRYQMAANFLNGIMDEVVVFKRALSDADIDDIYSGSFS